jgi:hypothetical protein
MVSSISLLPITLQDLVHEELLMIAEAAAPCDRMVSSIFY